MPAYPWLAATQVSGGDLGERMKTLRVLGVPYTDTDIAGATQAVAGKTEQDAVIAYLQNMGVHIKSTR
jgi:cytochrome c oxidase cbb3-type subunit 2